MSEGSRAPYGMIAARIDEIVDYRSRRGWSYCRIAQKMKCSVAVISCYCLKFGIEKAGAAPRARLKR